MASRERRKDKTVHQPQDIELEAPGTNQKVLFLEKVRQSNDAIQSGDFHQAIQLYSDAISLDPINHILFSNRSAAYVKIQEFDKGLKDANKACDLNPKWPKGYYRKGVALQCLGRHAEALAAFSSGLEQDPKSAQLLAGLVEAGSTSLIRDKFIPIYQQLQKMKLDKSPFVIIAVVGQELLAVTCFAQSSEVLESALKIGTCSLKLRGSVFSALSSAYWGLGNSEKALNFMQQDLVVAKSLGDEDGQCRAHGNLGSSHFAKGNYKEALKNHKYQLVLAMKLKNRQTAATALSSLGHVYSSMGDYQNALASHKQCVLLVKQANDRVWEAREIGNVGAVYLSMGEFQSALECHNLHLQMAKELGNKAEEARAYSNLGSAYHYNRNYDKAFTYHTKVLEISQHVSDKTLEARAFAGLGHVARAMGDMGKAKVYHEKQLDYAIQTKDKAAEGRACSNLGIIFHQLQEYKAALKLHKVHLSIAKMLQDRAAQGRAYGNIGNAYSALKQYELAVKYHKQELAISKEVNDRHSEAATHGNLAVAYQALNMYEQALQHYHAHLNIAQELRDTASEARALSNLGNYHSSRGEFTQAIPFYQHFLTLSQELQDVEGEGNACHKLGYAHYSLGTYREAIRYYEQDLTLARDQKDQVNMGRAYCNLGLANSALSSYSNALDCQHKFLTIVHALKNFQGKFRALGNIGDVLVRLNNPNEAIKMYNQQLKLAKQVNDKSLEASAYGALGVAHKIIQQYDKALGFHNQELNCRQETTDTRGECRAHGNMGNVHMAIGNYRNAYKCYEEQLDRGRELRDSTIEAQASGNLGITQMNLGNYEDAIGLFEQQLATLEQVTGYNANLDKGRACGNLGDCYEALGDFEEAVKCHEQYLTIAQNSSNPSDQGKAYRGLGNAHRSMGNLQQALVCFEKRLVVAHELDDAVAKGSAYGELGCLHSLLGNFDQAILCLEHQLSVARDMGDHVGEGDAACGLGGVYQQMGEYDRALEYHQMDLRIAQESNNMAAQCRAHGNLGLSHESLANFDDALMYQEQHLRIATQMNDMVARTLAFSSLGRVHHALSNFPQAVQYLQQGLQIAEMLGRREDEAKIRHRLGLALWGHDDLEESQQQLYKAAELFENIRREGHISSDYRLSLFDLQTASYQALQRVLVALHRHEEALVVAERGRTRAFVDLLLERQLDQGQGMYGLLDMAPVTIEHIMQIVSRQKAAVIYYSIAAGYLYGWLLLPQKGLVKFHECTVGELDATAAANMDDNTSLNASTTSLLDQYVGNVRESLGVETHVNRSLPGLSGYSESESDVEDVWNSHLDEINKIAADTDRSGFLRMVNRNHVFNSSNYSLSSLFSVSLNGISGGQANSTMNDRSGLGHAPLSALYQLLIAPMEEALLAGGDSAPKDIVLVLQGDLYLVPFSVLRDNQTSPYLFERFNLLVVPSLTSLQSARSRIGKSAQSVNAGLVVGNPVLPQRVQDHWQWADLPAAEQEAKVISEVLGTKPLIGRQANKDAVFQQMSGTEIIHLATHISWKLSAIVLSPDKFTPASSGAENTDTNDSDSDISNPLDGLSLSDFLLTAADVLNIPLSARLVVLSSGHTDDRAGRINSDGVVGLTRALLAAGAQCVLLSLWPVPQGASQLLLKTFYNCLLQGLTASHALKESMKTVQSNKQFSHESNWASWVLVGNDIKLSSKQAMMGRALQQLLQMPSKSREALRVMLHLIEKSIQRINRGEKKAMYTTRQSIEAKVGNIPGWSDLLSAVGFRFESASNGLPSAVFFPTTDPGDRLSQCSSTLQAFLGLPSNTFGPLSKLLSNYEAGEAIISMLRDVTGNLPSSDGGAMNVKMRVKLWRVTGCHEFLASLGFDLVDVGQDEVTLTAGRQAGKRVLQFALQVLVAIVDSQDKSNALSMSSSSSMESLASTNSGSATSSTFSKGSTPPASPHGRIGLPGYSPNNRMSPALRANLMQQGGLVGRQLPSDKSPITPYAVSSMGRRKQRLSSSGMSSPGNSPSYNLDNLSIPNSLPELPGRHSADNSESSSVSSDTAKSYHRKSLFERTPLKGYFPSNVYNSSSQSESEDGPVQQQRKPGEMSHSFKRIMSSGSSPMQRQAMNHLKSSSDFVAPRLNNALRRQGSDSSAASNTSSDTCVNESPSQLDPTLVAQMVMSETMEHRAKLEEMQRQSIQQQQLRNQMRRMQGPGKPLAVSTPASAVAATPVKNNKPRRSSPGNMAPKYLGQINEDLRESTSGSPVSTASSLSAEVDSDQIPQPEEVTHDNVDSKPPPPQVPPKPSKHLLENLRQKQNNVDPSGYAGDNDSQGQYPVKYAERKYVNKMNSSEVSQTQSDSGNFSQSSGSDHSVVQSPPGSWNFRGSIPPGPPPWQAQLKRASRSPQASIDGDNFSNVSYVRDPPPAYKPPLSATRGHDYRPGVSVDDDVFETSKSMHVQSATVRNQSSTRSPRHSAEREGTTSPPLHRPSSVMSNTSTYSSTSSNHTVIYNPLNRLNADGKQYYQQTGQIPDSNSKTFYRAPAPHTVPNNRYYNTGSQNVDRDQYYNPANQNLDVGNPYYKATSEIKAMNWEPNPPRYSAYNDSVTAFTQKVQPRNNPGFQLGGDRINSRGSPGQPGGGLTRVTENRNSEESASYSDSSSNASKDSRRNVVTSKGPGSPRQNGPIQHVPVDMTKRMLLDLQLQSSKC